MKKTPSKRTDNFKVLTKGRKNGKTIIQSFLHEHIFKRENLLFNYRETEQQRNLYLKLSKITPLANYAEVKAGIKPYEKGKGNPPQSAEVVKLKPYNSFELFDRSWYKLIRGTQINRYSISWDGDYLKYGEWLAAPRNPKSFFNPKIVIRRTDDKLLCSFDDSNLLGLNSIHCLQCVDSEIEILYLLALLNSKLLNWFFQHENFHMVGKPLAEVKVVFVERLPIIKIDVDSQQKFVQKVNLMLLGNQSFNEKDSVFLSFLQSKFGIEKLNQRIQNWYELEFGDFLKELKKAKVKISLSEEAERMQYFNEQKQKAQTLKSEIDKTDNEIDRMVYELYGLTEEEIEIVEGE